MTPAQIVALVDFRYLTDALTPERGAGPAARPPARRARRGRPSCWPRRLPGLHDVGRLAGLRRRQDPAALPRGAGRRLDAVQDEGRGRRRGRRAPGDDPARGDRARTGCSRSTRTSAGTWARRSRGWSGCAPFDPYWIEEPTSPDDVLGPRRDRPRRRRRSASRPASTSRTGSCSSSSSQAGRDGRLPDRRLPARRRQRGRRGPAAGGAVRRPGLPARRRRRPVRARPAPRGLRLHRGQRLARRAGWSSTSTTCTSTSSTPCVIRRRLLRAADGPGLLGRDQGRSRWPRSATPTARNGREAVRAGDPVVFDRAQGRSATARRAIRPSARFRRQPIEFPRRRSADVGRATETLPWARSPRTLP